MKILTLFVWIFSAFRLFEMLNTALSSCFGSKIVALYDRT